MTENTEEGPNFSRRQRYYILHREAISQKRKELYHARPDVIAAREEAAQRRAERAAEKEAEKDAKMAATKEAKRLAKEQRHARERELATLEAAKIRARSGVIQT